MIAPCGNNRRARLRTSAAAIALLVLLPACAGPRQPIELTVKEFPGDVLLGKPDPEAEPPPVVAPAVNLEPAGFPSFIQPPPPVSFIQPPPPVAGRTTPTAAPPAPTTTKRPVDPCPKADPFEAPAHEASRTLSLPPAAQVLSFGNDGSYEIGFGGETDKGGYPAETERRIEPEQVQSDGSFAFNVEEDLNGEKSTTGYVVDPDAALYLAGITTTRADGSTDRFRPTDPRGLPLLPLPVRPGQEFTGLGFDPVTQTSMTISGTVGNKVRVDACGTPLDAWSVTVEGQILAPNKQLDFTATYAIGTQYGGISLRDEVEVRCRGGMSVSCDRGRTVQSQNIATVATEPVLAGRVS